jgi:hypothetical protein
VPIVASFLFVNSTPSKLRNSSANERFKMIDIPAWTALAEKLHKIGLDIFATANVRITDKGFADEKVLALALLARTLSHLKGTLLLLREKRIVEARTITRCCYENLYWVVGLDREGEEFGRRMLHDEMSHRKHLGQFMFENDITLEPEIADRLRGWLRDTNKRFAAAKTLNPKQVAALSDIGRSYIFYGQLSSDSGHPSITALNRHVVPDTADEVGGIDVEPVVKGEEIEQTLELLCQAVMGVCVGVNQMLGGTQGGSALNGLADEYVALSNQSASKVA